MNELMNIIVQDNGQKAVSVRELYNGLGLQRTNFKSWYKTNILDNEFFSENVDWKGCMVNIHGNETIDFAISIDFAKHLAMMARTPNSHKYRSYLIEFENQVETAQYDIASLVSTVMENVMPAMISNIATTLATFTGKKSETSRRSY